jgi:hypothetical protein
LEVTVKLYPLVFSFRNLIAGNGYVASVAMHGRVVLAEGALSTEGGGNQEIWMFGVQPGDIAGGAGGDQQRSVAFVAFKKSYDEVLQDIAAEATSYEEFKEKVTEFFGEVNGPNLNDWEHALGEVRAGRLTLDELPTVRAASKVPSLTIEKVVPERVSSDDNDFHHIAEAA